MPTVHRSNRECEIERKAESKLLTQPTRAIVGIKAPTAIEVTGAKTLAMKVLSQFLSPVSIAAS